MADFVSLFIEYTKDYESPTSFWKWSAYSAINATLRHNVFLKHPIGKFYPNTYTILLADAAKYRKGAPLGLVNEFITEAESTKIFSGGGSIQGILDKLSQAIPSPKKSGKSLTGGSGMILAEELASFFVDDPKLLPLLTNVYDYKEIFTHDLRGVGFTVKNLCVCLLAASNETHLREIYTSRAVYGGLLRRTILVTPDETRPGNSLFDPDKIIDYLKVESDKKVLKELLCDISKLAGEMKLSYSAATEFTKWYLNLYNNYGKYGSKSGVIEGIHALVIKIAISIAASRCEMEISQDDVERAILEVTSLRKNYEVYSMAAGQSDKAKIATLVMTLLWQAPNYTLRKKDILLKHWNDMTSTEFDEIMLTFQAADMVSNGAMGNEPAYVLTQKAIDQLEAKIKP
jgi:hypothetical protein